MDDLKQNDANEAAQPEEKVVMQIMITKDGQVKVAGMINDKIAAFGILEVAKECITAYHEAAKPKIVKAPNGVINFARNLR